MAANEQDRGETHKTFRLFSPSCSCLQTKNLLWLERQSRFFDRLTAAWKQVAVFSYIHLPWTCRDLEQHVHFCCAKNMMCHFLAHAGQPEMMHKNFIRIAFARIRGALQAHEVSCQREGGDSHVHRVSALNTPDNQPNYNACRLGMPPRRLGWHGLEA